MFSVVNSGIVSVPPSNFSAPRLGGRRARMIANDSVPRPPRAHPCENHRSVLPGSLRRQGPIATVTRLSMLRHQRWIKIDPVGVIPLDQIDLPITLPFFDL